MKEFNKQLPDQTYSLRLGKTVPEGDVNLAYVHTPKLDSDQNIALVRTTAAADNTIPMDQIESMVVPDKNGMLQYADIISDDQPIILRAPYDMFPSRNVNITKRFVRNEHTTSSALYYKFELKYHYDSEPGEPGKVVKYTGNQIQLTDENGNQLDSTYKHVIYVQAMSPKTGQASHVYRVLIYLQFNSNEEKTFKVRYNHVATPTIDDQAKVVKKSIELYTNEKSSQYIEGGKLRIINAAGAFEERTLEEVQAAGPSQEIYAIEERPEYDGYRIYVPQKAISDPRDAQIFNYKLNATYTDIDGNQRTITFGYITDSVLNQEALLDHELLEYAGEYKLLGLKSGGAYMDARSLMQMVAPLDLPSLPIDTVFTIEDAEGNLLYTTTSAPDKLSVETEVNAAGSEPPRAKSAVKASPWEGVQDGNVRLKNLPISHQCTVFAEYQQSEFPFTFEASGEGQIIESTTLQAHWGVKKELVIAKKDTTESIKVFTSWTNIGKNTNKSDWKVIKNGNVDELYLTKNEVDLGGFYNQDALTKKNYMFSADVRIDDNGYDDDVIGIMFRVRDSRNYYAFAWEKDKLNDKPAPNGNGLGRILMSYRGISAVMQNAEVKGYAFEPDMAKYLDYKHSFKSQKKKIFKAVPSFMPPYNHEDEDKSQFYADMTGASYVDITAYNSNYDAKGWEIGKKYRITVVVTDDHFRVYIKENPTNTTDLGNLVCEGTDTGVHEIGFGNGTKILPTHNQGAYGIFNVSQEKAYWSNLVFTELEVATAISDLFPVTFTANAEMRLSDKTAQEILQSKIDALVGQRELINPNDPIVTYVVGDMTARIKNDGYVYGYTNNPAAGGTKITPWRTSDHGLNIKGSGIAFLQADGTMGYQITPSVLEVDVPDHVKNFKWTTIRRLSGDSSVTLSINGNRPVATAPVPPITPIGTSYTTAIDEIYKSDGVKILENVITEDGILAKLGIPSSVAKKDILLRIERGDANGNNKEYRVNYRFMYNLNGVKKFEVDQMYGGVNRMRLRNILKDDTNYLNGLQVHLVAWTNFEDLESVPVLAIRIDDTKKIEIDKPRVEKETTELENWYVRIKNGRMKRRIRLPYYEPQERTPQIYISHPELLPYKPASMDDITEVVMDYTIPEYVNQEFINRPVVLVEEERPVILNETSIQVRHKPITLRSEVDMSYLEVKANRINNSRRLRISDVDAAKGIIYLHDRIRDQDDVVVRYAYDEEWFTYRGFNTGETKEVIDIGAPVQLDVRYEAALSAVGQRIDQYNDGEVRIQKALLLSDFDETSTRNANSGLLELLESLNIEMAFGKWTEEMASHLEEYDLLIGLHLTMANNPNVQEAIRRYLANGGSAIFLAEHEGFEQWNNNLRAFIRDFPDVTLVPDGLTTENGTFVANHPLTEGCSSFTIVASSYFVLTGDRFVPIAYMDEKIIVAAYENGNQKLILIGDSNFLDMNYGFKNPGNRKFIENVLRLMRPRYHEVIETKEAVIHQSFTTTLASRESVFQERVHVGEISLREGFGEEMKAFIGQYVSHTLTLTPNIASVIANLEVIKVESMYRSDGAPIDSRPAISSDIIDVYLTVKVPVVMKEINTTKGFFHMDFNPSPGHTFTLAKNGFHRWIPVNHELEEYTIMEASGEELLVRSINVYLKPTSIWLSSESGYELIPGSVSQTAIYHTDEDYWFDPRNQMYDPSLFRLGKVFVQANSDIHKDMVILDTRTRGGGLDEELSREIIAKVNKESLHHWDIGYFDGEAYQENGVIIIRLPRSLLNRFTESQIQAAVAKWKGYGILPIIEYHDDDMSVDVQEI